MQKPRIRKADRRPRLQVDTTEVVCRAVAIAAAREGKTVSEWVVANIKIKLIVELKQAKDAIDAESP